MDDTATVLDGRLTRIRYQNPASGFCSLDVLASEAQTPVRAVGILPKVFEGALLTLEGGFSRHRPPAKVFEFERAAVRPPEEIEQQIDYLAAVTDSPRSLTEAAFRRFGRDIYRVLETTPERILELDGVDPGLVRRMVDAWQANRPDQTLDSELRGLGLPHELIEQITEVLGAGALALKQFKTDPYQLIHHCPEVGFRQLDQLARQFAVFGELAPRRIEAAVLSALYTSGRRGATALGTEALRELTANSLNSELSLSRLEAALESLRTEGRVSSKGDWHALQAYAVQESQLDSRLKALRQHEREFDTDVRAEALLQIISKSVGESGEAPHLLEAVQFALLHKVCAISCVEHYAQLRIAEALQSVFSRLGASSRLVAPVPQVDCETPEQLVSVSHPGGPAFRRDHPLPDEVVIFLHAEALSSEDLGMMVESLAADTTVVFIGDPDGQPPAGPGQPFVDLLRNGTLPACRVSDLPGRTGLCRLLPAYAQGERQPIPDPQEPIISLPMDETDFPLLYSDVLPTLGLVPHRDCTILSAMPQHQILSLNEEIQALDPARAEAVDLGTGSFFVPGMPVVIAGSPRTNQLRSGLRCTVASIEAGPTLVLQRPDGGTIAVTGEHVRHVYPAYLTGFLPPLRQLFPTVVLYAPRAKAVHAGMLHHAAKYAERLILLGAPDIATAGLQKTALPRTTVLNRLVSDRC